MNKNEPTNITSLWRRVPGISKGGLSLAWKWQHERYCNIETAKSWLEKFSLDEPTEVFCISIARPKSFKQKG